MVHRGIATLSGLIMFCFLALSAMEPTYFFIYMYQSLIYLVIILMLFYLEDHWAYMLGMLAPAAWIILVLYSGILQSSLPSWTHLPELVRFRSVGVAIGMMVGIITVLSVLMIAFCGRHWKREFAGLGKGASTFSAGLAIIIIYYGILVLWFKESLPPAGTP